MNASGQLGAEAGADALLVDRVGEGVDEADGDRIHLGGADGGDRRLEARLLERAARYVPSAPMRSATSYRRRRGTSGGGFFHKGA